MAIPSSAPDPSWLYRAIDKIGVPAVLLAFLCFCAYSWAPRIYDDAKAERAAQLEFQRGAVEKIAGRLDGVKEAVLETDRNGRDQREAMARTLAEMGADVKALLLLSQRAQGVRPSAPLAEFPRRLVPRQALRYCPIPNPTPNT